MLLFAGGEKIARDCSLRSPFGASSGRSAVLATTVPLSLWERVGVRA